MERIALTQILQYARNGINWDMVIDTLLQTNPESVLAAIESCMGTNWEMQVKRFAIDNSKVPVIRMCRELTGMGLKEAKEWVETNCERFQ